MPAPAFCGLAEKRPGAVPEEGNKHDDETGPGRGRPGAAPVDRRAEAPSHRRHPRPDRRDRPDGRAPAKAERRARADRRTLMLATGPRSGSARAVRREHLSGDGIPRVPSPKGGEADADVEPVRPAQAPIRWTGRPIGPLVNRRCSAARPRRALSGLESPMPRLARFGDSQPNFAGKTSKIVPFGGPAGWPIQRASRFPKLIMSADKNVRTSRFLLCRIGRPWP